MNYQKTIIAGHLGRDPETRYLPNGDAVCNFSIAVTEKRKDEDQTTWFRCIAFKKTAEVVGQYLKKGNPALVEGRIQEREWQDKDGAKRRSWELIVDRLQLGGKPEGTEKQAAQRASDNGMPEDMDSDLPF